MSEELDRGGAERRTAGESADPGGTRPDRDLAPIARGSPRPGGPGRTSYTTAFLSLAALFFAFFLPLLVRGEVIYPHDNSLELGVERDNDGLRSNRKFSDLSSAYVPEIAHHLHGDHAAWLSTWNPHVELGRPSMQISGLSPVFPLTRALMWLIDDEFVLYTWLTVLTVALIAGFGFAFLRSLALDPWACFAGAATLSMGVFSIHYASVVMLLAGLAWSLALLWAITRFVERRSFALAAMIAFATYALFLSGYAQQIVWHAYLIGAYALVRACSREPALVGRVKLLGLLLVSALAGLAMTAPVYADLAWEASQSGRLETDHEFFLARLPKIASWSDLGLYFAQVTDAFWKGNPITIDDQDVFNGLCFTPAFVALFLVASIDGAIRRAWLWLGFGALTFVMTVWPPAYLFGVDHLGFSFSRFVPLRAGVIPIAVAAAISIDAILRGALRRRALAVVAALVPLALAFAFHLHARSELAWPWIAASVACFALTATFIVHRAAGWIVVITAGTVLVYGRGMLLARPLASIVRSSPLVERLRELTPGGLRYACVGARDPRLLPPNQEARLGLASIHSYDPLSSKRYQDWVLRISETGARTFGRQFRRIASEAKLSSEDIAYAGVSVLVTTQRLASPRFEKLGEVDGARLYAPIEKPVRELLVAKYKSPSASEREMLGAASAQTPLAVRRIEQRDDFLRFEVAKTDSPKLLVLSQQFHARWKSNGEPVIVNGFYQGVEVAPEVTEVTLEFAPFAVWSWIPQVVFALCAVACVARALGQRRVRRISR